MAKVDKLLKYLTSKNIAADLDEETRQKIADDVILGMQIDEETREDWLEINRQAVAIIKQIEEGSQGTDLYEGQCKVIYPLLAPAIIQLSARMSTHVTRNNKTLECAVLGPDKQIPDPEDVQQIQQMVQSPQFKQQVEQAVQQGQQPPQLPQPKMVWEKDSRAKRTSSYINYKLLIESQTWLQEEHKLNSIVAGWGTGFKQVYYDFVTKTNCSEVLPPENVVINHNISCLEKAPRVTVKHYMSKNDIISNIRAEYFLDVDLDSLMKADSSTSDSDLAKNDSREKQPVYEILCQTCYIDLDEDEYAEPYKCYVNTQSRQLLCIVPAFDETDILPDEKGNIIKINRRLDIVDRHLLDSPDGKYYSLGLNSLLLHPNKAITSINRQLIDAGTLSNAAAVSGFVTKAFKTKERNLRIKLGQFQVLDCNPTVDPQKQIFNMPFREPSQVLLALLQLLIETSKNSGFINDILTGDVEMQNVPATTSLAMVEQSTRAFKPIIENVYISLKKEFTIHFYLNHKYLEDTQYARFEDSIIYVAKEDFDLAGLDIAPVADPTLSSEAHGFAQSRALMESAQIFGPVLDMREAALRYYTQLQFNSPEKLIAPAQQQQPDPKMMELQLKSQIADQKNKIDQMAVQLEAAKLQNEQVKLQIKQQEFEVKAGESNVKKQKMLADAHKDNALAHVAKQQADTAEKSVEVESRKVDVMKEQAKNKKLKE